MGETYTIEDIEEIIQSDGLGHAIQHNIDAESIEDGQLRLLWLDAKIALEKVEDYLDGR